MKNTINNSKVYVKQSKIHGKGLFAKETIKEGELIGHVDGIPSDTDGPYVLWIDEQTCIEVVCNLRFINHSDNPNACYYDTLEVSAIHDIQKDDEITHNYNIGK